MSTRTFPRYDSISVGDSPLNSNYVRLSGFVAILSACVSIMGCVDLGTPEINVPFELTAFGGDSGFVMTGTASVDDVNGPCPVWLGDNGVVYHLFQSPSLPNDIFDQVVGVGTTSRLVLSVRTDLELNCAFGRTAVVLDVLEVQ